MFTKIKRMTAAVLLFLAVLMLLSSVAQTQTQRLSVEEHMNILKNRLKLSDAQTKKIRTILEDQREEVTIAMNDNRNNPRAMNTAIVEITKKTDSKIKKNLTETQVKTYDKMVKDRQAQVGRRMKSIK